MATKIGLRGILLKTVSAGALLIMVSRGVDAQEAGPNFWVELGGQYDFWEASKSSNYFTGPFQPAPNAFNIRPDDGFHVFGGVGARIPGTPWGFAFRGKYGESGRRSDSASAPTSGFGSVSTAAAVRSEEQHTVIDFEVGRDVGLGASGLPEAALRIKGGVRYTHFKASETGAGATSIGFATSSGTIRNKRKFEGFGPRIGFEGSVPLDGGAFSLDFNAAGAVLFGKQKFQSGSTIGSTFSRSKPVAIPNIDAFAGVSWLMPAMNGKLSVGYGVDAYFDMVDAGHSSRSRSDRIFHGPVAKFTIDFPAN